jgi:protein SCO1
MSRRKGLVAAAVMVTAVAVAASITAWWIGLALRAQVQPSTKIGGPFMLIDDAGVQVTDAVLKGRPTVMYFGYTFCPDICPTTLTELAQWIHVLGADADKLNYVFVTVDPERDTPKVMHDYVSAFDWRIRGFTGTPEQIAKITSEYHVSTNGYPPQTVATRWIILPAFILWTGRSDFLGLSPMKRRLMWRSPN